MNYLWKIIVLICICVAVTNQKDNHSPDVKLKFLTPNTKYPVILKDHYGRNNNTQWYKHGSKEYIDQLPMWNTYFKIQQDQFFNDSQNLLLLNFDYYNPSTLPLLDHYEPKRHDSIIKNNSNDTNSKNDSYYGMYFHSFSCLTFDV